MADTYDVLSLTEAKRAVKVPEDSTAQDTKLAMYNTAVSRAMERTFGPIVQRSVSAELHDGGCSTIYPDLWPIASVGTLIEYDTGGSLVLTAESVSSYPVNGYILAGENLHGTVAYSKIIRRDSGGDSSYPHGRRNVSVTYVAGRAATTAAVDAQFKLGASLFLKNVWRAEEQSTVEVDEFEVPVNNYPRFATPNAVKELLHEHRQDGPRF
jgi:hypothetical protein